MNFNAPFQPVTGSRQFEMGAFPCRLPAIIIRIIMFPGLRILKSVPHAAKFRLTRPQP